MKKLHRYDVAGGRASMQNREQVDIDGLSVTQLSAICAGNDALVRLVETTKPYRWARQTMREVPQRPADGDPFQAFWDDHRRILDTAPLEVVAIFNSADLPMVEIWDEGEAWDPVVTVCTAIESDAPGRVKIHYVARDATPDEIRAERAAAHRRLSQRFQEAKTRPVTVTVDGKPVRFAATEEARAELAGLRDRLARRGGSKTIRTRAQDVAELSADDADRVVGAIDDRIDALQGRDVALGAALDATQTITAIRSVDIDSGWPE